MPDNPDPVAQGAGENAAQHDVASDPPSKIAALTEKSEDLDAIKKAVEDAAAVGAPLWVSYLFLLFYIAIASAAVTHADLLLERPVDLPFLSIKLPLRAFFILAPLLFLLSHAYTMAHFALLADKAKHFHLQLRRDIPDRAGHAVRERLRRLLPINIFVQFLAGPEDIREGSLTILLWATAWTTLVATPVALLLLLQLQFLPYHDTLVSSWHRVALLTDLVIILWLWMRILSGRSDDDEPPEAWTWRAAKAAFLKFSNFVGVPITIAIAIFSWTVASFPGEWDQLPYAWLRPPQWSSATEAVFGPTDVTSRPAPLHWPFHSLRLKEFDLYNELKVEDPKKVDWKKYLIDLQQRHLEGADFSRAKLPKTNLSGAVLRGANLSDAEFSKSNFENAHLEESSLKDGHFEGALFEHANLQGSKLDSAELEGDRLAGAQLQGASLFGIKLEGADLSGANLEGAWLFAANLHATNMVEADLRGASVVDSMLYSTEIGTSKLDGASFRNAHLHGSDFVAAAGKAIDLTGTYLWRTNWGYTGNAAKLEALKLDDKPNWKPFRGTPPQLVSLGLSDVWNDEAQQHLMELFDSIPNDEHQKETAIDRIANLKCSHQQDASLASCNPAAQPTPDVVRWQSSMEKARAKDPKSYQRTLATTLRELVCANDPNSIYILRGLLKEEPPAKGKKELLKSRLSDTQGEAKDLVTYITSDACPVSRSLSDTDKVALQKVVREAAAK